MRSALALLAWYATHRPEPTKLELYETLTDKLASLISPLWFFIRSDPFPAPFSIFGANVVIATGLILTLIWNLERPRRRWPERSLWITAGLIGTVALLLPLEHISGSNRPDERWVLTALLLALAAARYRPFDLRRGSLVIAIGVLAIGLHAVEFRRVGGYLGAAEHAMADVVEADDAVASLSFWGGRHAGGCRPSLAPTLGVPMAKWVDQSRFAESGGTVSRLMPTSLLTYRPETRSRLRHWVKVETLEPGDSEFVQFALHSLDVVEVFGCADDLSRTVASTARHGANVVAEGEGFVVLRKRRRTKGRGFPS